MSWDVRRSAEYAGFRTVGEYLDAIAQRVRGEGYLLEMDGAIVRVTASEPKGKIAPARTDPNDAANNALLFKCHSGPGHVATGVQSSWFGMKAPGPDCSTRVRCSCGVEYVVVGLEAMREAIGRCDARSAASP